MANEKNLEKGKATQFKSGENAANAGRNGGIASGKKKRHMKELKAACLALIEGKHMQGGEEMTGAEILALTAFKKAAKGDWKAWELIRDTAGQKPIEKAVVSTIDANTIQEVEAMVKGEHEEDGGDCVSDEKAL